MHLKLPPLVFSEEVGGASISLYRIMLWAGILTTFGSALLQFATDQQERALLNTALCVIYLVALGLVSRGLYVRQVVYGSVFATSAAVFLMLLASLAEVYWVNVLPLICFALFGQRIGLYWSLANLAAFIIVLVADQNQAAPVFSLLEIADLVGSHLLVIVFAYLFVMTIELHRQEIARQSERLLQAALKRERMEVAQDLAGGMVHLINNEMQGILGLAELLTLDAHDETMQSDLDRILELSGRASNHASQLLAYSRAGKHNEQRMDIYLLLSSLLKSWESDLPERIGVRVRTPSGDCECVGDPVQLGQALRGMPENAREAIEARLAIDADGAVGVVTVAFEEQTLARDCAERDLHAGRYLVVAIGNNGCGMDRYTREGLFDPFYSTKFAGRGMGLAAAEGTIRSHRGHIDVESREGEGTLFRVWLPLAVWSASPC